jgi:DNA-binding NarL/FixJ family response regulator
MESVRTVLADDHAVVRAGIANALRELPGLQIVGEVGDGDALFAILAQAQPDFLLTDVTMPSFEPIGTIRQIRARYPALKILVVSAYDDDVYVQGLLGAGVNGYHLKDQPLSDLRLAVQRVLAGERWVCSPLVDKLLNYREAAQPALPLTARQRDILRCLREGLDNQAIAWRTGLSVKTIENHLTRLYRQINVQSRLEAANYVAQHPEALGPHEPPAAPFMGPPHAPGAARLTILIVDDNMRYRTQMRRMIGKAYPQALIYEAENTRVALRQIEDATPVLAFVDVVLGDENGIDCVHKIHSRSAATRIILISAYPDREFHRLGMSAGAVAFLDKKDLNAAALREVIDDLVV